MFINHTPHPVFASIFQALIVQIAAKYNCTLQTKKNDDRLHCTGTCAKCKMDKIQEEYDFHLRRIMNRTISQVLADMELYKLHTPVKHTLPMEIYQLSVN